MVISSSSRIVFVLLFDLFNIRLTDTVTGFYQLGNCLPAFIQERNRNCFSRYWS